MAWFAKRPKGAAQSKRVVTLSLPPPVFGLNIVDDPHQLDPRHATILKALVPDGSGLRFRTGTKYHIDAHTNLRSLLAFHGATSADDRLFAADNLGIYNATTAGAALPAASVSFGTTTGAAGYCNCATMVTSAGPFLLVCDEVNGYYHYDPSGPTWTKATAGTGAGQINGVDPALLTFVTIWKNRVWFIQGGTGRAWYLPVGQYAGTVQSFDFGNKFSTGGSLVGLYSWTHDGGAGIDDHLVAVSSNGDVLVYAGTDPASAGAFNLVGSWSTGGLALQRRFAVDVGGDLWLWLRAGLLPISALKTGTLDNPRAFVSYPVRLSIREAIDPPRLLIHHIVEDRAIYCGFSTHGLLVHTATRAWSTKGGSAPVAIATFQGKTFEATATAIRYVTGTADDVARDGSGGTAITAEWATGYRGGDARWKNWTQFRARFSSAPTPGASYFDSTDPTTSVAFTPRALDGSWVGLGHMTRNAGLDVLFTSSAGPTVYGLDMQFIPGGDQ